MLGTGKHGKVKKSKMVLSIFESSGGTILDKLFQQLQVKKTDRGAVRKNAL